MRWLLPVAMFFISALWLQAQPAPDPGQAIQVLPGTGQAQVPRMALVIGNGAYSDVPLRNPPQDARDMAAALERCGFKVQLLVEATLPQMEAGLRKFGIDLKGGGVGLFFFAGHGMQVKGVNYLIPVGAEISGEDEVKFKALDAGAVLAKMEAAGNGLNLMILDACRNNPFSHGWQRGGAGGLAQMEAPTGTYVAFSTAPGHTAADGAGDNGLYTRHLLHALQVPDLKVEEVFKRVRVGVKQESGDQQVPWDSSSLTGDFYFLTGDRATVLPPAPTQAAALPAAARRSLEFLVYRKPGAVLFNHTRYQVMINARRVGEIKGNEFIRVRLPDGSAKVTVAPMRSRQHVVEPWMEAAAFLRVPESAQRAHYFRVTSDWKAGHPVLVEVDEATWNQDKVSTDSREADAEY